MHYLTFWKGSPLIKAFQVNQSKPHVSIAIDVFFTGDPTGSYLAYFEILSDSGALLFPHADFQDGWFQFTGGVIANKTFSFAGGLQPVVGQSVIARVRAFGDYSPESIFGLRSLTIQMSD